MIKISLISAMKGLAWMEREKGWESNMNLEAVGPGVLTCSFCVATTELLIMEKMKIKGVST